jgi:hypothetical protein
MLKHTQHQDAATKHIERHHDIMLGVYSKAATCVRQTMYTADRNIPASQLFALPCLHVILAA